MDKLLCTLGYVASAFWWIHFPAQHGQPWLAVVGIGSAFVYMFFCLALGHSMSAPPTPTTGDVMLHVIVVLAMPPLVAGIVSLHLMAMH